MIGSDDVLVPINHYLKQWGSSLLMHIHVYASLDLDVLKAVSVNWQM